jgi:D-aminopeptidase
MFNHLTDAHEAAVDMLAAVLDEVRPPPPAPVPPPDWLGAYIEPESGLATRLDMVPQGQLRLRYGHVAERLELHADGTAHSSGGNVRLRPTTDGLWMDRPHENLTARLLPCNGAPVPDCAGRYRCAELDAELTIADAGGVLYGGFSGFLGQGRMELLDPIGPDLWALPCPRALDQTPPGDWTLAVQRDDTGRPSSVEVGCWLARRLPYARID